jgi:hypothetical protein
MTVLSSESRLIFQPGLASRVPQYPSMGKQLGIVPDGSFARRRAQCPHWNAENDGGSQL